MHMITHWMAPQWMSKKSRGIQQECLSTDKQENLVQTKILLDHKQKWHGGGHATSGTDETPPAVLSDAIPASALLLGLLSHMNFLHLVLQFCIVR